MPTQMKSHLHVEALQNVLDFGPWDFFDSDVYDEIIAAQVQLTSRLFTWVVGGINPIMPAIQEIQYLVIVPDQTIAVGLNGVNAETSGFTLQANRTLKIGTCSMTSLSLFNTTTQVANIVVVLGGRG